jgi:predicted nucleic acid-binding protein
MKIVFDANVYLAATKKGGYAYTHLQRSQPNGPYQLFISPEIILEVRDKLEAKFNYSSEDIILECAVEAAAHAVVTADRGLLQLKSYQGIVVIHPTMLQYLA